MTRCDHGIRLDRFCADCESGFTFADTESWDRANRHRAGTIAALCFLVLAVCAAVAVGRN